MEAPSTPPHATTRYGRARTPPSPTHGPLHQEYEPYSPRRSSRNVGNPYGTQNLSSKPVSNHIPPLQTPKRPAFAFTPSELFPRSPPKSPAHGDNNNVSSLLKTPHRSSKQKGSSLLDPSSSSAHKLERMLPTPSKTPTMTPSHKHNRTASVENTARVLHFHPHDPNDVMPQRRNKYKQRSMRATGMYGLDLDGDDLGELDGIANPSFEIYAESHARVPQLDQSEENPFYRPRATTVPALRTSPRRSRKSAEQLAEEQHMDDATSRDEGLVYMFRGKKVFRKFGDVNSDSEVEMHDPSRSASQRALKRSVGVTAERPLTRSSIQPRLLFPTVTSHMNDVDEEAETDVDMSDAPVEAVPFNIPATPAKNKSHAPRMMSPPTTSRATRKRNAEEVPVSQDDMESTPAKAVIALPTPQRSSKKKKVDINPIPTFESEPDLAEDDVGIPLTPQRSSRKTKATTQLTPIVEDQPEPAYSQGSAPSSGRSSGKSPFDDWPRTKKRDGQTLDASSKRTRSSVA